MIMPSWWEIAKAPRKEEEQWREMTQEEQYIYLSEDNGRVIVERDAGTLFARALEINFTEHKVSEQLIAGNILAALAPMPNVPVGPTIASCANSIRYILHLGKPVRISW